MLTTSTRAEVPSTTARTARSTFAIKLPPLSSVTQANVKTAHVSVAMRDTMDIVVVEDNEDARMMLGRKHGKLLPVRTLAGVAPGPEATADPT